MLTPGYINRLLDTVDSLPEENRTALETEVSKIDDEITTVIKLAKAGGDVDELGAELKKLNRRRTELRRTLAEPTEQPDRGQLRLALQKRVKQWREILRSHPTQSRQVLRQLIGTIQLPPVDMLATDGNPTDQRGKEGITDDDVALVTWTADSRPVGLLEGLEILGNSLVQTYGVPNGIRTPVWP